MLTEKSYISSNVFIFRENVYIQRKSVAKSKEICKFEFQTI